MERRKKREREREGGAGVHPRGFACLLQGFFGRTRNNLMHRCIQYAKYIFLTPVPAQHAHTVFISTLDFSNKPEILPHHGRNVHINALPSNITKTGYVAKERRVQRIEPLSRAQWRHDGSAQWRHDGSTGPVVSAPTTT